jgi:hypothetical protein
LRRQTRDAAEDSDNMPKGECPAAGNDAPGGAILRRSGAAETGADVLAEPNKKPPENPEAFCLEDGNFF